MTSRYELLNKVALVSDGESVLGQVICHKLLEKGCHVIALIPQESSIDTLLCHEYLRYLTVDFTQESALIGCLHDVLKHEGGLDYLIHTHDKVNLYRSAYLELSEFDSLFTYNMRVSYILSKHAASLLRHSENPHILYYSPPLVLDAGYFSLHSSYTNSKYAQSMFALGLAHELYKDGIAVNCLWPRALIDVPALQDLGQMGIPKEFLRKPHIIADAMAVVLAKPALVCTGTFMIDDLVLQADGVKNFQIYQNKPYHTLIKNMFIPKDTPPTPFEVDVQDFSFADLTLKH